MSITLKTAAAGDPVTLAEARDHCEIRANNTSHDTKLAFFIKAATAWVEKVTGQDLVERTWNYKFDRFPAGNGDIVLPKHPVQSVTTITYTDSSASPESVQVASSVFGLDTGVAPNIIYLKRDQNWPSITIQHNGIDVEFVTGYAPAGSPLDYTTNVPDDLRAAVLMVLGDLFEHREANLDMQTYRNEAVENMIQANRIFAL